MRALILIMMLSISFSAQALPNGIGGYSGKGGTSVCSSCHDVGAAVPTLALTGSATLTAGVTGNYTLTVSGGPGMGAGVNVALSGVNSGSAVFTAGSGTRIANGEVVHSTPGTFSGGKATFTFAVKAPLTAGVFTLSVAALSTNNDTKDTGDGTAKTTLDVNVSLTAGAPATGAPDAGTVAAPMPGVDAGSTTSPTPTTPGIPSLFPAPDAGAAAAPAPLPVAGSYPVKTGPLSEGVVDGGCSSTGGVPTLLLLGLVGLGLVLRRSPRQLR